MKAFKIDYGTKFPKAVEKITDDVDVLLEFYNYPADHWVHLRTTNPIESTFATVRLRTKVTKGPGSRGGRGWRWRSSSSRQRRAAGAWSTRRTSSRWSGPARRSTRANWSNARRHHPDTTSRIRRNRRRLNPGGVPGASGAARSVRVMDCGHAQEPWSP